MKVGDTFYLIGPESNRPHLWVVVSDPEIDSERIVIINLTSDGPDKDRTCIVSEEAHPRLTHDSCVNYPCARMISNEALERAKGIGALDLQEPLAGDVLRRIQQKAAESEDMRNKYRQILIDQGLCDG